jgi:hypothetical protein
MAFAQAMCTSFKVGVLNGAFNFGTGTTQVFKIALYDNTATLSADTTAYTTSHEVSGTGYTAGGMALTVSQVPTSSSGEAYVSFSNATWSSSTLSARGALIYLANGTTNPAIAVLDFGSVKTTTAAPFTVQFPLAAAGTAIIRFT